jgi:hypothetical protein
VDNGRQLRKVCGRSLRKIEYKADNLVFIPFSSKTNWTKSYPYAIPSCECSCNGMIIDCQLAAAKTSKAHKKRKRGGPQITKAAVLTYDMRDKLHIQMYKYFQWLSSQLNSMQSTSHGRILLSDCGCTVLGVQTMLSTFESVFSVVKSLSASVGVGQENEGTPLLEQALEDDHRQRADERIVASKPEACHLQKMILTKNFRSLWSTKISIVIAMCQYGIKRTGGLENGCQSLERGRQI